MGTNTLPPTVFSTQPPYAFSQKYLELPKTFSYTQSISKAPLGARITYGRYPIFLLLLILHSS